MNLSEHFGWFGYRAPTGARLHGHDIDRPFTHGRLLMDRAGAAPEWITDGRAAFAIVEPRWPWLYAAPEAARELGRLITEAKAPAALGRSHLYGQLVGDVWIDSDYLALGKAVGAATWRAGENYVVGIDAAGLVAVAVIMMIGGEPVDWRPAMTPARRLAAGGP